MTFTLLSPAAFSMTVNSVCSSFAAAAAAPPAAGPATATAAAADTPNFSSMSLMSCESSRTVILPISSRICVRSIFVSTRFLITQFGLGSSLFLRIAIGGERAHELPGHLVQRANELRHGRLHRAHELRQELFARRQQRQRLDVLVGHHGVRHRAAADHEALVFLGEVGKHLRTGDWIGGNAV